MTLAFVRRADLADHKRGMLLATFTLMDAAIARGPMFADYGPAAYFGLTDLFVVALAIFDIRSRGRPHPVTLWGGLLLVASQPLRLVVMGTEVWMAFV